MRKTIIFYLYLLSILILIINPLTAEEIRLSPYPNGKNFAFTITDDPDNNTLSRIKPVYDYLSELGFRTTIAVWLFNATRTNGIPDRITNYSPGDTCENPEYLNYLLELKKKGFEIASHGPSAGNDLRDMTIKGYQKFYSNFGYYPKIYINHKENLENLYWGNKVAPDFFLKWILRALLSKARLPFSGEIENSNYFWGDIVKEKTKYVRLFGTNDIDTLKFNPSMPYHDSDKPYVNYWFSFSNGNGVKGFKKLLSKKNVSSLINQRGTCILYTHFGYPGFFENGEIDDGVANTLRHLSNQKDGWFVPASTILDRLRLMKKVKVIKKDENILIINNNDVVIDSITLINKKKDVIYNVKGRKFVPNSEGEIVIGSLKPHQCKLFRKKIIDKTEKSNFLKFEDIIYIINNNTNETLGYLSKFGNKNIFNSSGEEIQIKNEDIESINPANNELYIITNPKAFREDNEEIGFIEKYKLFLHRALVYLDNRSY